MSKEFIFKEKDLEGEETLRTIAAATRFNRWMYDVIRPHCTGRILEIGSGIGNISKLLIDEQKELTLSDLRSQYCDYLSLEFPGNEVLSIDLVHDQFENKYQQHLSGYDTVFALNVIEHIEDDNRAISNIFKFLRPGGKCVILVPAFQFLYNSFDEDLYHYRRYNRSNLNRLLSGYFQIVDSKYFNPIGILGWYLNGSIFKRRSIPGDQMKLFDQFVPVYKMIDFFTRPFLGLSVISVGVKK